VAKVGMSNPDRTISLTAAVRKFNNNNNNNNNNNVSLVAYSSTQRAIDTTRSRTPRYKFWFYQAVGNMLNMGMESHPETSENFHTLFQQSA
jgi:hypothetical protein